MNDSSSFVSRVPLYTDWTASSLKAKAYCVYLVHLVLSDVLKEVCRFLIEHGNTCAALLPVCTSEVSIYDKDTAAAWKQSFVALSAAVLFSEELSSTSSRGTRNMNMNILYMGMRKITGSLCDNSRRSFQIFTCGKSWKFHLTIAFVLLRYAAWDGYVRCDTRWDVVSLSAMSGEQRSHLCSCAQRCALRHRHVQSVQQVESAARRRRCCAKERTMDKSQRLVKKRTIWNSTRKLFFDYPRRDARLPIPDS